MELQRFGDDSLGTLRRRDLEILDTITARVRFLSIRQVTETFFASDVSNAIRRLKVLEKRGFLVCYRLNTRTPPAIDSPMAVWSPGQEPPRFSRLAYLLSKRWQRQGSRIRSCYFPGPKFEALTGIPCQNRPIHPLQASHDLGLAELYLHFRNERPSDAICWVGENARCVLELKNQQPDAVLVDSSECPTKAIEYGGLYNAKRLDRFHRWCQQRRLPYEIW